MTRLGELLPQFFLIGIPGYLILQVWFLKSWSGDWRRAAFAPLALIGPAVLFSMYAFSKDSNLWPMTVVLLAPFGFLYLVILWSVRTYTLS